MTLFHSILKLLKNKKISDFPDESRHRFLLLNFILLVSGVTSLIFAVVHIFFFEQSFGYVLFTVFVISLILFVFFNISLNYKVYSTITILIFTVFFSLITLIGAGNKTGLIWGLAYPVMLAFTTKYRQYNIWSLFFLGINLGIFFIPNHFEFWSDYSSDIIMRYLFAYLLIYTLLEFYLRLKQQTISKQEKELIETKHHLLEKDKFISSLSYEIRTPLNNITGIINHQRESISEDAIDEIELSISNLALILNKIPKHTESNILHLTGEKTLFKLNEIIKKTISLFQTDKYTKLRFNLFLSSKLTEKVYGDRISFMQILISTIDFFFNRSNENPLKIDIVSQETENETILIKVSCKIDNLIFPENLNAENLINNLKDLEIINQISESLNVNLTIKKDTENFSTLFKFNFEDLPVETVSDKKDSNSVVVSEPYTHKKILLKDANVLLVEDDIINSKVMTLNIQKLVKKIIIAGNGKEALEKFSETKVDIILMDIRMPLMDGFKTTEKIREAEIGTGSRVPIIAVTANASSEVKKHCFEVGMNDYTTKPTNYKLLLKKMKKLLEG